jgi:drug/metabolite transporter (DMT)-like permease
MAHVAPLPRLRKLRVSPYLLLTLTPFFWACNWIMGRAFSTEVPPLAMTFYRWLFAALILAPFALPRLPQAWPVVRRHWRILVILGMVGVGTHNALAYIGLNFTTATNGVILNSFIPVMIISFSWLFLRERLTPLQFVGVGTSLLGVLTILSGGSLATLAALRLNVGDLLVIMSMAMWSGYTLLLRRRPAGLDTVVLLFVLAVIGDLCVLPFYLAETHWLRPMTWTWTHFIAIGGVALFSSVLAYLFWNAGVAQVGASVAGLFVHLMPVFGVLLAWLLLDERLAAFHFVGIALILTGIYITTRHGN